MTKLSKIYSSSWGLAGQTLPWKNRIYRKIKNNLFKHQQPKGRSRKVLLVAHNEMMLMKMSEVVDLFEDDSNIQWYSTICSPPEESVMLIQKIHKSGYIFVHPYYASLQLWDLIVSADHGATHNFSHYIPTLMVGHGLGDGKVIAGSKERYHYARRHVLNKNNKPRYTCLFEASDRRKQEVIKDIPALTDSIAVVGNLEVDKLLSVQKERAGRRASLGYRDDDIVIYICSSHGTGSFLDTIGHELIAAALTLPEKYKFILATHYLNWQKMQRDNKSLGESLLYYECERVRVLRPNEDYITDAVAADVCISDFTSMALLFPVLNCPVIFVPFPNSVTHEEADIWKFYCEAPRINDIKDLHLLVDNAITAYPEGLLEKFNVYPADAAERMKNEIYKLLGLV